VQQLCGFAQLFCQEFVRRQAYLQGHEDALEMRNSTQALEELPMSLSRPTDSTPIFERPVPGHHAPESNLSADLWSQMRDIKPPSGAPAAPGGAGMPPGEQQALLPLIIIGGAAAAWLLLNPSRAS
jgi:hypothetical protein